MFISCVHADIRRYSSTVVTCNHRWSILIHFNSIVMCQQYTPVRFQVDSEHIHELSFVQAMSPEKNNDYIEISSTSEMNNELTFLIDQ
jgi:hypothetical protein